MKTYFYCSGTYSVLERGTTTMKKTLKGVLCAVVAICLVLALTGCAKINYVTNGTITAIKAVQDGSWQETDEDTDDTGSEASTIEPFVANTYGGVEFKTEEDVINYYKECFDYTKTLTANYTENGDPVTYYKMLADEHLTVENVLIEGKSNGTIDNLIPSLLDQLFSGSVYGLPPSKNRNPELDKLDDGSLDLRTSPLQVDDVAACNVADNGDGTITITIQPKGAILSMPGKDSQGRFFNTLGDISSTVESISMLSFSSGTINDNFVVNYEGGTGVIKIDTATKEILEADYTMLVHIDVQHANILVIKDKSASLDIIYKIHAPADDQYILDSRNIVRA